MYPSDVTANPLKRRLFGAMSDWADVVRLDPAEAHPALWRFDLDCLHVARYAPPALADMRRAELAGVRTVNATAGARLACDRLARSRLLRAHDVRVPRFEFGTDDAVSLDPPVVVKRRFEYTERDHVHRYVRSGPVAYDGERLVESLVGAETSYKCYRVGEAVRTVTPSSGREVSATDPPSGVESLARAVGDLFGLTCCEVDLLAVEVGRPYVVDVNPAVSLRGVPDGRAVYESHLRREARRAVEGE
ncbi:hypothetical protein [Halomarina ordinaria]|uniref:ATP-grasp domain-containing protein n=1 Tax=Halomarina ordinaria TaxID=3033939 RepID=A0ABD5UEM5_9EURY|nr:hypothetical protein [Halomarina sp. PSRA2]